jgi:hypothetical protein
MQRTAKAAADLDSFAAKTNATHIVGPSHFKIL